MDALWPTRPLPRFQTLDLGESNPWGKRKKNSNKCNRQLGFRTRASNSTSAADRPPGERGNSKEKKTPRSFEVRSFSQLRSKILFTKISELWMKEYFQITLIVDWLVWCCYVYVLFQLPFPCNTVYPAEKIGQDFSGWHLHATFQDPVSQ